MWKCDTIFVTQLARRKLVSRTCSVMMALFSISHKHDITGKSCYALLVPLARGREICCLPPTHAHGSPTSCPCREWWWCRLLVEITREDLYASVCLSLYALALEVNLDDFELIYILTHLNDHIYRLRLIQKVLKSGLRTSLVRTTTQLYNDRYRCL